MAAIDFSQFGGPEVDPETILTLLEQQKVDTYNAAPGKDDGTGIDCSICHNKGDVAFLDQDTGHLTIRPCKCAGTRLTVQRLQRCGIWERARRCKLEDFKTDTPTQRTMKETVQRFIEDAGGHWLMLCGQSGCGKTHLTTAAFVQLSYWLGLEGQFFQWNQDSRALKAATLVDETGLWDRYKQTALLLIDDLFKGAGQGPSDADIRLAFEILDHRYNNDLITIISSELTFDKLLAIDQAIAGRIKEKCGPYLVSVATDPAKNYRLSFF